MAANVHVCLDFTIQGQLFVLYALFHAPHAVQLQLYATAAIQIAIYHRITVCAIMVHSSTLPTSAKTATTPA
jgi:hypothetical protein